MFGELELADITRTACKGHDRFLVHAPVLDRPTTARRWPQLLDVSVRGSQPSHHNATIDSLRIQGVSACCPAFKGSADTCGWLSQFRRHAEQKAPSRASAAAKEMGHRVPEVQYVSPGKRVERAQQGSPYLLQHKEQHLPSSAQRAAPVKTG